MMNISSRCYPNLHKLFEARQTLNLLACMLQNQALLDETGSAVLDLVPCYIGLYHCPREKLDDYCVCSKVPTTGQTP